MRSERKKKVEELVEKEIVEILAGSKMSTQ
jgi:hypothetical protein